jgi:hypothetical protein
LTPTSPLKNPQAPNFRNTMPEGLRWFQEPWKQVQCPLSLEILLRVLCLLFPIIGKRAQCPSAKALVR